MGLKRPFASQAELQVVYLDEGAKRQRELMNLVPVNHAANENYDCLICRSLLIHKCIQCTAAGSTTASSCVLSFGACGCVFHQHCLGHWLHKSYVCPVHETAWQPVSARPFCCEVSTDRRR